ncbi:MAG TPA: flavin reductase family protein [Firmicutes bacterium]|jgi:flavin reductase (DIM6/NTAB) family NADH-FMN oxidoreductase RutF|nr:flavin reductase family protein [Bacillota bacterium]
MEKLKTKNYPLGPFPTILAGADVNGKPNFTTIGACGVVCLEPVLYISLKETHYSTTGVKENGYFSVNIPTTDMVQKTDYCGMVSGKTNDKSDLFTSFYDEIGKAPMIEECPVNFLCKVIQTLSISGFEMFFGEIVATYVARQCITEGKPDPLKINPMMIMGDNYWSLGSAVGYIFKEGQRVDKK